MTSTELERLRQDAIRFLLSCRSAGTAFGQFKLCAHAYAEAELSATNVALELWRMLDLPLSAGDRRLAIQQLQQGQHPESGLMLDPSWEARLKDPASTRMHVVGDSFFTRCAACALWAWDAALPFPVAYLADMPVDELPTAIRWGRGGHDPFSTGDLGVLLYHNERLQVPGASALRRVFLSELAAQQDVRTGLWLNGNPEEALTPSINFSFHSITYSYNQCGLPLPRAEQIIDSCLQACRDERFYSWEHGYACNDLDLALMFYSASLNCSHRQEEVMDWARERLPMILAVQKPDGGFSFYHERAMDQHAQVAISPGEAESDLWGTLMYLGCIRMMSLLAYPELQVPWGVARVHLLREPA